MTQENNQNLTKCLDCQGAVSKRAGSCPHCGAPSSRFASNDEIVRNASDQAQGENEAPAASRGGNIKRVIFGVVVVIFVLGIAKNIDLFLSENGASNPKTTLCARVLLDKLNTVGNKFEGFDNLAQFNTDERNKLLSEVYDATSPDEIKLCSSQVQIAAGDFRRAFSELLDVMDDAEERGMINGRQPSPDLVRRLREASEQYKSAAQVISDGAES